MTPATRRAPERTPPVSSGVTAAATPPTNSLLESRGPVFGRIEQATLGDLFRATWEPMTSEGSTFTECAAEAVADVIAIALASEDGALDVSSVVNRVLCRAEYQLRIAIELDRRARMECEVSL